MIVCMKLLNYCKIRFGSTIKLVNFTNFRLIFMTPVIYRYFMNTLSSQILLMLI